MDTFEIARLTDFDFEAVCKDLFEVELGTTLEIFAPGRDQGVDLRHIADPNQRDVTIIQCKHWERTKSASLTSNLKNKELAKIKRLSPSRYILATSVDLTPKAKDRLLAILTPYTKSTGDIYGLQQIEALLRGNMHIVRRHMRLWLSSSAVLQTMLAKNILTRSADLADDVRSTMLIYVPNDSFDRGTRLLADQRVCIITGGPGIGKTTLAQMLTVPYANSGYEVYEVSDDADEINAVWDDEIEQLFYYDDFLGQTSLADRFNKNEDSRLLRIIRKVNASANKAFILTTREYLLEEAKQIYERINRINFNIMKCIVTLDDYTDVIRAEILYNHLYFSNLSKAAKASFANPASYGPIVRHGNFNPRLIEYSLKLLYDDEGALANPAAAILANFENPRAIWEHIVLHQLQESGVDILIVLYTFARGARLDNFEKAYETYRVQRGHATRHLEFVQSLKILENTMVRMSANRIGSRISYDSGSVRDYMRDFVANAGEAVPTLLSSAIYFEQVEALIEPAFSNYLPVTSSLRKAVTTTVRDHPHEVADAIARTFTSGRATEDEECGTVEEIVPRVATVLNVAMELRADELIELVADWLDEEDIFSAALDSSDVVVMLLALWESSSARLAAIRPALRDAAIDYFFSDTSDWDNIEYVESFLSDLGDIAPQAAIDRIEQEKFDYTERRLSYLSDDDWPRPNLSDLENMVRFAHGYQDAEELFPGLSYAEQLIEQERAGRPEPPAGPSAAASSIGDAERRIFEMFSTLARDGDAG